MNMITLIYLLFVFFFRFSMSFLLRCQVCVLTYAVCRLLSDDFRCLPEHGGFQVKELSF